MEKAAAFLGLPFGTYYDAEVAASMPSAETMVQVQAGTKGAVRPNDFLRAWTARWQDKARARAAKASVAAREFRQQQKEQHRGKEAQPPRRREKR